MKVELGKHHLRRGYPRARGYPATSHRSVNQLHDRVIGKRLAGGLLCSDLSGVLLPRMAGFFRSFEPLAVRPEPVKPLFPLALTESIQRRETFTS